MFGVILFRLGLLSPSVQIVLIVSCFFNIVYLNLKVGLLIIFLNYYNLNGDPCLTALFNKLNDGLN